MLRPIPRSERVTRRVDDAQMPWEHWLRFMANAGLHYVFDKSRVRPHVLRRDTAGPAQRVRRFPTQEDVVAYLRRHSLKLLRQSYLIQRDTEYVIALRAVSRANGLRSPLIGSALDYLEYPDIWAAHVAHQKEAARRYRYFGPEDLVEAARLWRDETTGIFPPHLRTHVEQAIAGTSAETLAAMIDSTRTDAAGRRKRL